jgi:dipicolinate synthase subunit B
MSSNLANISRALMRKSVYLVPMRQDDPIGKPHSLVADFGLIAECVRLIEERAPSAGAQMRPLFLPRE